MSTEAHPSPTATRAAALLAAAAAACSGGGPASEPAAPPDVVLIVLDTVRADHVSCYGYARRTTPHLDALAATADRHEVARSTAPWTLPSHASLFTGRFAFQHGADAALVDGKFVDAMRLAPDELTLAEALAAEGYATAAFVANRGYVNASAGLDQGFATFEADRKAAAVISARALEWLDRRDATRPCFLFLNYMDAHRPYNTAPLPPERARELPEPPPAGESGATYLDALYEEVFAQDDAPPQALVQQAIDAYDLGVANADLGVGMLLDGLRARGLFDGALVIVCSDHGEYFGEHDLVEHSKDVYEPALRVPLIVKRPAQAEARVVPDPISLADVPRLVLAAMPRAIRERHARAFPGSEPFDSMLAEIKYSRAKDLAAPWAKRFLRERAALIAGRYKLIRSTDGQHELYDLESDPGELTNLFARRPADARALMQRLERTIARGRGAAQGSAVDPTDEELGDLRETGYIGDDSPQPPEREKAPRKPR